MDNTNKDYILQGGVSKFVNPATYALMNNAIQERLKQSKSNDYNPLLDVGNYINIPVNLARNAKEFGEGLYTVGGEFVKPIHRFTKELATGLVTGNVRAKDLPSKTSEPVKKAFMKAVESDRAKRLAVGATIGAGIGAISPITPIGGMLTGGMIGALGPKDFTNSILSTYNISTDKPLKENLNYKNIAQGIFDNPLYATMDIAGVGGIGKKIGKASKSLTGETRSLQEVLPGKELAELNRTLTNEMLWSRANQSNLYRGYNQLASMPLAKRQEIVKYIVSNTGDLTKEEKQVADLIKKDLRFGEQEMARLGIFTPEYSKANTVAQYAMSQLGDTNLLHKDLMDIIQGKSLRPTASKMFEGKGNKLSDRVLNLLTQGEDLYNKGDIAFLTQKYSPSYDPLGEVIARHENLKLPDQNDYARIIGRSTPEELGQVLDDSIKAQLDRTSKIREGLDVFKNIINEDKLGLGLDQSEKLKFINAFRDSLRKEANQGKLPSLKEALSNSAIDTKLKEANKNHLYKALEGFFSEGVSDSMMRRGLSNWKKSVLGTPAWVIGNRLGNWSLNGIEGVTAKDYLDTLGKYNKYVPDVLKQQTSFNNYINMGAEGLKDITTKSAFTEPLTNLRRNIGRYSRGNRALADKLKLALSTYSDLGSITANPLFKAEAGLEFLDRSANFIRQAKREAKATKQSVEDILQKAKTDKDLFLKLNTQVNKSLGDYVGRNYAMPQGIREAVDFSIPFNRFLFQTGRTTLHDMANHPLAFATNVTLPARVGAELNKEYVDKYKLNPDMFEGGVPYLKKNGKIRTMSMQPTPIGIISKRVSDPSELFSMASPIYSIGKDIFEYKKFDKTPSSPGYTKAKLTGKGKENYIPSGAERFGYFANTVLGNTFNPYILSTRYVPNIQGLISGEGSHSLYDTMQPIAFKRDKKGKRVYEFENKFNRLKGDVNYTFENPETYKKTTPVELLGNIFGISTRYNYPQRASRNQATKNARSRMNIYRNIEENR